MSSFGALIAKLQYVKHAAFFGTPDVPIFFVPKLVVLDYFYVVLDQRLLPWLNNM